jgi:DHA2 family multidrug resistance protein
MWAFVDIFRWLSLLCFVCVIVVWFFKKTRPGRGPAGAH